jgi:hypothetical protein
MRVHIHVVYVLVLPSVCTQERTLEPLNIFSHESDAVDCNSSQSCFKLGDSNRDTSHDDVRAFLHLPSNCLSKGKMLGTEVVEKYKMHILLSAHFSASLAHFEAIKYNETSALEFLRYA